MRKTEVSKYYKMRPPNVVITKMGFESLLPELESCCYFFTAAQSKLLYTNGSQNMKWAW